MNSQELATLFGVPSENYVDLTLFAPTSKYMGFSVQRSYPPDCAFLPARTRTDAPDTVVLIHVGLPIEDETSIASVPLLLKASKYSKYLQGHLDYNEEDANSPTETSVLESKKSVQPIDLDFTGEYAIQLGPNPALTHKATGNRVLPTKVLDDAFDQHCKTTRTLNRHRLTIQSKHYGDRIFDSLIGLCKWMLQTAFGFQLEESQRFFSGLKPYEKSALKRLSVDSIKIFNYQASKRSVIYFAAVAVTVYAACRYWRLPYDFFHSVFSSSFLSVCASVLLLWLIDDALPQIIFRTMNLLIRLRGRLIYGP